MYLHCHGGSSNTSVFAAVIRHAGEETSRIFGVEMQVRAGKRSAPNQLMVIMLGVELDGIYVYLIQRDDQAAAF